MIGLLVDNHLTFIANLEEECMNLVEIFLNSCTFLKSFQEFLKITLFSLMLFHFFFRTLHYHQVYDVFAQCLRHIMMWYWSTCSQFCTFLKLFQFCKTKSVCLDWKEDWMALTMVGRYYRLGDLESSCKTSPGQCCS